MEIFYFINSHCWNKGYTTEAVKIFLAYIKENKLVSSLIGTIMPRNIASSKILINNGFKKIVNEYNDERDIYEIKIY
jgi:ribosomal-protein-alanine N-acetyltransferase